MDRERERLCDLELRSLLAEQARQQAHRLRTPLNVITLITETLQLESPDDPAVSDRLRRLLTSVLTLTNCLSDAVSSTRFCDGPPQRCDAVALAARVVGVFGGRVSVREGEAEMSGFSGPYVFLERNSFEAALVHALRLVGIRAYRGGTRANRPLLQWHRTAAGLRLDLSIEGPQTPEVPGERADLQLMEMAAERTARDIGGVLSIAEATARFELPLAPAADS